MKIPADIDKDTFFSILSSIITKILCTHEVGNKWKNSYTTIAGNTFLHPADVGLQLMFCYIFII